MEQDLYPPTGMVTASARKGEVEALTEDGRGREWGFGGGSFSFSFLLALLSLPFLFALFVFQSPFLLLHVTMFISLFFFHIFFSFL